MARIDTHDHLIPPDYLAALHKAGLEEAGGRALPDWSPEVALEAMAELDIATAILSVSTPGTAFLPAAGDQAVRALDELHADGVVLLANNAGIYLGQDGQDELFAALDARSAVVFIHPADLPGTDRPTASHRSPRTSCSTPPAPLTCWCATEYGTGTRTSGSS